jgi:hypothetical protein
VREWSCVSIYWQTENKKTHSKFFLVVLFGQSLMPMGSSSKVVRGEGMELGVVMATE